MYNAGLILEGGAMRGVYTCGVTDFFIDQNIEFLSLYGVSSGAGHACSYVAKQKGRAFRSTTEYLKGSDYCGLRCLIKNGSLFNMDFIYDTIPHELLSLDNEAFCKSTTKFYAVVTPCDTGKPEYLRVTDSFAQMNIVRASGSLPIVSHPVEINGRLYFDGGISDSIPLAKSIADGNKKNVIIATRDKSYRKSPEKLTNLVRLKYKAYPELIKTIEQRHIIYNNALDLIEEEEKLGNVLVIRPKQPVTVKRADKNIKRLTELYNEGYSDAKEAYENKFHDFFGDL